LIAIFRLPLFHNADAITMMPRLMTLLHIIIIIIISLLFIVLTLFHYFAIAAADYSPKQQQR
jgi:hypothetical protein